MAAEEKVHDCIIIGAGPGGLQAAIYLARYNRDVLLLDRGGGRTGHARHVENFLGHPVIDGRELLEIGRGQVEGFGVSIEKATVTKIEKKGNFEVHAGQRLYRSRFVIVSTGARDNLLDVENLHKFFATSIFTCLDCDGYRTMNRKLLIIGNTIHSVRLAFGMKEMYTSDITVLLIFYDPPPDFKEELADEGIPLVKGRPARFVGGESLEAVELEDGRSLPCEVVMWDFGYKLNDSFLSGLPLEKDAQGFKYVTNRFYESSLKGLYILGPLTGNDQIVISAAGGALAAIDIKKNLLEI